MNTTKFSSLTTLTLLGFFLAFGSCNANKNATNGIVESVHIVGDMQNCPGDSMRLYEINGPLRQQIGSGKIITDNGKYSFDIQCKIPGKGLYAIGGDARSASQFVLGDVTELSLSGNCQNKTQPFVLKGSPDNDAYKALMTKAIAHNQKLSQLQQNMQMFSQSDPSQLGRLKEEMKNENNLYFTYLDSVLARTDLTGKIAQLYNFRPFGSSPEHEKYPDELAYFKGEFFSNLDFNDPQIAKTPQIFEKSQFYSGTLSGLFPEEETKKTLNDLLSKATVGSDGHNNLLKGVMSGLEQRKSDLYIDFGKLFITNYGGDPIVPQIQQKISQMEALMPGQPAPVISGPNPAGNEISLANFKGKYVMIDFWASWCKPCRRENPNVVKAYQKYHSAGFEILGVSLDEKQDRWKNAITQDQLSWPQISDLKGWASQPAAAYSVTSIPATYLVDKEGNILAKNLRGPSLESKLQELFGF